MSRARASQREYAIVGHVPPAQEVLKTPVGAGRGGPSWPSHYAAVPAALGKKPPGMPGPLRREIHAAQEVLVARVGAQGIKDRFDFEEHHTAVAVLEGLLQPREGLVFFAQAEPN